MSRLTLTLAAVLAAAALGGGAHADTVADTADSHCYVPYAEFEQVVPHLDLLSCPEGVGSEDEFCRLGLSGETVYLYRFEIGTSEDCLVGVDSYRLADFIARFGPRYEAP